MTPLVHNYSRKAGLSFWWDTSDSQEHYQKNLSKPETKKRLSDLGFIDNPIEYKFNSHGFRTHEFDQKFDAVCFGCSFTMGTGIHEKDTWPRQTEIQTGLRIANLAHAGSSNDTAFRFANYYLKFLRPKWAIWLQTDRQRIELLDSANSISLNIMSSDVSNPCAKDYFIKSWFATDENQLLNLQKNTLAFLQICNDLQIVPIVLDRTTIPPHPPYPYGTARDLTHPGPEFYKPIVEKVVSLLNT